MKARDLGWKAGLEPSVQPDRALAKSPAPDGWTSGQGPGSCAAVSPRPRGGGAAQRAARSSVVCGKGRGAGVEDMGREDEGSSSEAPRLNLVRSLSGVRVLHFGCRSWFSRIPKWSHASCELLAVQFLTLKKRCYRHIRGF